MLALITHAFGSHGGIARFNQDLLAAIAGDRVVSRIGVVARSGNSPAESELPENVEYRVARRGRAGFAVAALVAALRMRPDVVLIGHVNFCFVGVLIARLTASRALLMVHGGEAWRPRRSRWVNHSIRHVDCISSVSELTLRRLCEWAPIAANRTFVLPCCVDLSRFTPGPRDAALVHALGLSGKRIVMTMGRLAIEEQAKGFDEVIEQLPRLLRIVPDLVYLICGTGSDEARLRAKAAAIGVAGQVVFAGFVPEDEKVKYYRLADAYVMPSRGEGFGIVILEALACGIPVMGSNVDGTFEALQGGALGACVDPRDPQAVFQGILDALRKSRSDVQPSALGTFSVDSFRFRAGQMLERLVR